MSMFGFDESGSNKSCRAGLKEDSAISTVNEYHGIDLGAAESRRNFRLMPYRKSVFCSEPDKDDYGTRIP